MTAIVLNRDDKDSGFIVRGGLIGYCHQTDVQHWSGCRANYGVKNGVKVAFCCTMVSGRRYRIGWSTHNASLKLGAGATSWAYCASAHKVTDNKFMEYGEEIESGHVVTALLDLTLMTLTFMKNEVELEQAFSLPNHLVGATFFPHVVTKDASVRVGFGSGQEREDVSLPEGFQWLGELTDLVPSPYQATCPNDAIDEDDAEEEPESDEEDSAKLDDTHCESSTTLVAGAWDAFGSSTSSLSCSSSIVHSASSDSDTRKDVWTVEGDRSNWFSTTEEVSARLSAAYLEWQSGQTKNAGISYSVRGQDYAATFDEMCQVNVNTGVRRRLKMPKSLVQDEIKMKRQTVWLVESNDPTTKWFPASSEVSALLTRAYYDYKTGKTQNSAVAFSIKDNKFTASFDDMVQLNTKTGMRRKLKPPQLDMSSPPPSSDDGSDMDKSISVPGGTLNMSTMTITSVSVNGNSVSTTNSRPHLWKFEGDSGKWIASTEDISRQLTLAYVDFKEGRTKNDVVNYSIGRNTFVASIDKMVQCNTTTGISRPLKPPTVLLSADSSDHDDDDEGGGDESDDEYSSSSLSGSPKAPQSPSSGPAAALTSSTTTTQHTVAVGKGAGRGVTLEIPRNSPSPRHNHTLSVQHVYQGLIPNGQVALHQFPAVPDPGYDGDDDVPEMSDNGGNALYKKIEEIGRGGFGKVYTAHHRVHGWYFAVKDIELPRDCDRRHVTELQAEVDTMKMLRHNHIVKYYGARRTRRGVHICLEYCPGGSLSSLLKRTGSFSVPLVKAYTSQILQGLRYLHGQQVLHRDIKAANILLTDKGKIKIADFGCCKHLNEMQGEHQSRIVGTSWWMAPEIVNGKRYSESSDIWALGCTVIEMLTAKPPWYEKGFENDYQALIHIGKAAETPPLPLRLSPWAKHFLECCLHLDPSQRISCELLLRHPFLHTTEAEIAVSPSTPGSNVHTPPGNSSQGRHKDRSQLNTDGGESSSGGTVSYDLTTDQSSIAIPTNNTNTTTLNSDQLGFFAYDDDSIVIPADASCMRSSLSGFIPPSQLRQTNTQQQPQITTMEATDVVLPPLGGGDDEEEESEEYEEEEGEEEETATSQCDNPTTMPAIPITTTNETDADNNGNTDTQ